jgi:putative molybdopterin biosynthesis protein
VAHHRARYVNRAHGTGTRLVLDDLLAQAGLQGSDLPGYDSTEPSHSAAALAIAAGHADSGLGIEVAARRQGLDFVPLVRENYYLACLKTALDQPATQALLSLLRTAHWQRSLVVLQAAQERKPAKSWSDCGRWKFLKRGCFMRSRVANEAPRSTLWLPKQGCE